MQTVSKVWREGIVAGLLGAGGVALWFFVVDLISGVPLYTPGVLGEAMLSVLGHGIHHERLFNAAAYTVVHMAAFIGIGVLLCTLVDLARRVPHVTIGLLLFFVVFEVGFYFVAIFLSQFDALGRLAWYQIGAANLVAALLMGGYIWRRHPELASELRVSLEGRV